MLLLTLVAIYFTCCCYFYKMNKYLLTTFLLLIMPRFTSAMCKKNTCMNECCLGANITPHQPMILESSQNNL